MIVGFKFTTPTDKGQFTVMTPNLLLAYSDAVHTKRDKISFWGAALLFLGILLAGNIIGFTNVLQGRMWFVALLLSFCISFIILSYGILWSGPKAALLCAVMGTENFETYIQTQLALMTEAIRPENIKLMHLEYKLVRHMQKVIVSMEILREAYDEIKNAPDLYSEVDFLRGYTKLYGFEFKDITKRVMKNEKKQRNNV